MDRSRLRTGEIVAGSGGVALFVFLFFDWFGGGAELTGSVGNLTVSNVGVSGWDALSDLPGFLIVLAGASGIALMCLAAAGKRLNIPVRRGGLTATLGALAVLLILWRMLAGSPTLKIGVFLGLAAAVAITVGALMALAEDGFQPLVALASARTTTVAAATPPPAKPGGSTTTKKGSSKKSSSKKGSGAAKPSAAKSKSSASRKTSSKEKSSAGKGSSGSRKK